ncbi:hypothetical protein GCM10023074_10200 [Microbispora amethystogenes]|uniref:C2H2-type domain-containing protein n=1 Tax=Microbispora amethystogenes TaxID=1427754 RepID=A0ABQ4FIJ3_9ACTN|nr:hypothetical protein Mam01_47840 [Microbispora amethystogenes]
MVPVRETIGSGETWPFRCLRCLLVWEVEYVVRRTVRGHGDEHGDGHDGHGGEGGDVAVWTREGVAVQPPWSEATCPGCGCGTVTTFPTGYLTR